MQMADAKKVYKTIFPMQRRSNFPALSQKSLNQAKGEFYFAGVELKYLRVKFCCCLFRVINLFIQKKHKVGAGGGAIFYVSLSSF
jgi:hypothetical protein